MTYENNPQYKRLVEQWEECKETEAFANNMRIETEKELLKIIGNDLKEKGTNNLALGLTVTTGMSESWDQSAVTHVKCKFDDGLIAFPFFPFKLEWKPDTKKMAVLKETMPDVFSNVFAEALTIKPKKASFSIKEKK
jgi:hypothetical protein